MKIDLLDGGVSRTVATDASNTFSRRTGRILAALVALAGLALGAAIIVTTASGAPIGGKLLTWTIIGGFLFNLATTLARWLLTRSRLRIYLVGPYPFALGLMKLIGLIAVASILLFAIVAAVVEPSSRSWLLHAVVLGLVQFAIILLFANGLANLVIITRHLNGTLKDTSRERGYSRT